MSFFTTANDDAKTFSGDQVALGPRVKFLDSFEAAWDQQKRTSAQNAIWAAYADEEDIQRRAMKEAGIENMPMIGIDSWAVNDFLNIGPDEDFGIYKNAARYYAGSGDEADAAKYTEYDRRIEELRKQYPDLQLRTGREMYEAVLEKGRAAEDLANNQRRTFGGEVGAFLGGGFASFAPRTDPLNALTFGVGGIGKTAVMRVLTEGGLQGVVEGMNQITGVQEQRQMMGLSHGAADAFSRVAGTALIGSTFRAGEETLMAAGRRWFRNTETDPAPPPPSAPGVDPKEPLLLEYKPPEWEGMEEWQRDVKAYQEGIINDLVRGTRDYTDDVILRANYGQTRRGAARARLDMDYVSSRLDAWDGEMPFEIKPRTSTSIPKRVSPNFRSDFDIHSPPGASIDALAREVDPKLFMEFDRLADRKAEYQRWLEDPRYLEQRSANMKKAEAKVEELSTKIDNLKYNMGRVGNRRRAEMQTKLDNLLKERDEAIENAVLKDTPEMAAIRKELMQTDIKMRDMYPEVSRAYAHARGEWELDAPNREIVRQMVREGSKELPQDILPAQTYESAFSQFTSTLEDNVPLLKQRPKVEAQLREGADAADVVQTILRENAKVMDEALTSYREMLDSIVKAEKEGVITMNGEQFRFDLDADQIYIPDDAGGTRLVTIREFLEENADTEAELKATQTCSIV